MTDLEIKVLKDVYDLNHIDDLEQLRSAISARDARMNALDQMEIRMRIGRKMQEALATSPNDAYTPATWSLLITALVLAVLSAGMTIWIFKTDAWLILRIAVGVIAFILFAAACRGVMRVIYRIIKHKDF
ncbi:MAG: hypothetical protein WDM80_02725 [Limisphaerales bacterium]